MDTGGEVPIDGARIKLYTLVKILFDYFHRKFIARIDFSLMINCDIFA